MKDFFLNLFNNENCISIIGILITALTTYLATKYSVLKPSKSTIKESQLVNVYLPLHRLLDDISKPISNRQAIEYYKKLSNILEKNYLLVYPQLHELNKKLKLDLLNNENFEKTLYLIKYQVDIEYNLLKKALGYPSESSHGVFFRMTPKQKYLHIYPLIDALWLFIPLLSAAIVNLFLERFLLIFLLGFVAIFAIIIRKMNVHFNSLKY